MIQLKAKTKISKKPKKKVRKVSARASETAAHPDDGLTPEDIAEINMFGAAIAKMNWEASKERWNQIVADYTKAKTKAKRRP